MVYKETIHTFFYDNLKTKITKFFFKNTRQSPQFGMPKKMTPKSQAKIKPSLL